MRFSIKQVAGLLVSIAVGVTMISYVVSRSRFPPTVEVLGQYGYNYAWTCIRITGVAIGVMYFLVVTFLVPWLARKLKRAESREETAEEIEE